MESRRILTVSIYAGRQVNLVGPECLIGVPFPASSSQHKDDNSLCTNSSIFLKQYGTLPMSSLQIILSLLVCLSSRRGFNFGLGSEVIAICNSVHRPVAVHYAVCLK